MPRPVLLLSILVLFILLRVYLLIPFRTQEKIPDPPKVQTKIDKGTFHDKYELAWIQLVDRVNRLVQAEIVESRVIIVFAPEKKDVPHFRVGSVAPVSFSYEKNAKGEHDFIKPYKMYVSNELVEVLAWRFTKNRNLVKTGIVHHGPGDKTASDKVGIIVDVDNGNSTTFLQLRAVDDKNVSAISKIKRNAKIKVTLPEDQPYRAFVNGVEMDIVSVIL